VKKKVWAEFEVVDVLDNQDTAMYLEIRFKGSDDSATVWDENPMVDEVKGKREQLARLALTKMFGFEFKGDSLCDAADSVFTAVNPRILQAVTFADEIIELLTTKTTEADLPRINTEADWLELGDGQQGLLIGRLDARLEGDSLNFTVTNTAWETFFIDAAEAITPIIPARAEVSVVVERYEDGIALVCIREVAAA